MRSPWRATDSLRPSCTRMVILFLALALAMRARKHIEYAKSRHRLHVDSGDLAVILLHPHGGLGGSMHDPLIYSLLRAATRQPKVRLVLAYNQAGVGGSPSSGRRFWQQDSSSNDLETIIHHLTGLAGSSVRFVIVGYSYGGCVAASAFALPNALLAGFVVIAPPIGRLASMALGTRKMLLRASAITAPMLCVHGDKDQFASVEQVLGFLVAFQKETESFRLSLEVLPSDHFFADRQFEVAAIVIRWIAGL